MSQPPSVLLNEPFSLKTFPLRAGQLCLYWWSNSVNMSRNNVFRTQAPCVDYAVRMSIKPEWYLLALPFISIAADVSEIAFLIIAAITTWMRYDLKEWKERFLQYHIQPGLLHLLTATPQFLWPSYIHVNDDGDDWDPVYSITDHRTPYTFGLHNMKRDAHNPCRLILFLSEYEITPKQIIKKATHLRLSIFELSSYTCMTLYFMFWALGGFVERLLRLYQHEII